MHHEEVLQKTTPAIQRKGLALNFFEIVLNKDSFSVDWPSPERYTEREQPPLRASEVKEVMSTRC